MKFIKSSTFLLLSCLVVFSSCDPDVEDLKGGVDLAFHSSYGNSYLVVDNPYTYGEYDVMFSELNFIFTELKITPKSGEVITLQSSGIIDFSDLNTIEKATEGIVLDFSDLPAGEYTSIQFDVGLGDNYAGTSPADYSTSDVLGDSYHYWPGWQNYIITRLEARFDSNADGQFTDESFQYHLGGDEAYRTIVLDNNFQILPGGRTTIDLNIDWREVLTLNDERIDPGVYSNTHTAAEEWLIVHLLDNMEQEIIIE